MLFSEGQGGVVCGGRGRRGVRFIRMGCGRGDVILVLWLWMGVGGNSV